MKSGYKRRRTEAERAAEHNDLDENKKLIKELQAQMAEVKQQLANAAPAERLFQQLKEGDFIKHEDGVAKFKKENIANLPVE